MWSHLAHPLPSTPPRLSRHRDRLAGEGEREGGGREGVREREREKEGGRERGREGGRREGRREGGTEIGLFLSPTILYDSY